MDQFAGQDPARSNSDESFTFRILLILDIIASFHANPFVRGHAAGWYVLTKLAMRREQSLAFCINAWVQHEYAGETFTVLVGSVEKDKNPDQSKQRPRPAWAVVGGVASPGAIQREVVAMLEGAPDLRCVLRETDSINGAPTSATRYINAPIECRTRAMRSLHSLLEIGGFAPSEAAEYLGHGTKRFLINVSRAALCLDVDVDGNELGRFSQSVAQDPTLVPFASMLVRHALRCSVLPRRYAGRTEVAGAFDRLCKVERILHRATAYARLHQDELYSEDPFGVFRLPEVSHASLIEPQLTHAAVLAIEHQMPSHTGPCLLHHTAS